MVCSRDAGGHAHLTPLPRPPGRFVIAGLVGGYASTAQDIPGQGWVCPVPATTYNAGAPATLTFNTGTTGVVTGRYTAPETTGTTVVTLTSIAPTPTGPVVIGPTPFAIPVVAATDLSRPVIPDLIVATHSDNHDDHNGYASPETIAGLQRMMDLYRMALAPLGGITSANTPVISAIALPQGGLFDYAHGNWCPPHISHRFGDEVDIVPRGGLVPKKWLARAEKRAGFFTPVPVESPANPAASHWHMCITQFNHPKQCLETSQYEQGGTP